MVIQDEEKENILYHSIYQYLLQSLDFCIKFNQSKKILRYFLFWSITKWNINSYLLNLDISIILIENHFTTGKGVRVLFFWYCVKK